jgi:phosphotriesterase-related protein
VTDVQTVLGPVPVTELGVTLMHEHVFNDLSEALHPGVRDFSAGLVDAEVSPANAWLLREDPYSCPDNCRMDDEAVIAQELGLFAQAGGRTVVDNTTGKGRDVAKLVRTARSTGLNIVMGSGWSLAHGYDDSLGDQDPAIFAGELVTELRDGVALDDGTRVRPGIIGEIGVGPSFTASERMTLVAAAMAQRETGVPLLIHLPGWQRRAHEVLDIVFAQGVDPGAVVLCHMDPSGKDTAYQREVADRRVWLEFDMIGMQFNFPGEGQSPSVEDTADAVAGLYADGYGDQLLLSQDVFLKGMWTRNGGNGYAFVPTAFLPRLGERGVPAGQARDLLVANPAAVFTSAAQVPTT